MPPCLTLALQPYRDFMTSTVPPQPSPPYAVLQSHPRHWAPGDPAVPSKDTVLGTGWYTNRSRAWYDNTCAISAVASTLTGSSCPLLHAYTQWWRRTVE